MKTISLLPCLLIASLSAASAAEHLWDHFDSDNAIEHRGNAITR